MPFQSKAQMKGAFSGALGPEMKAKAQGWADETPDPKGLPAHKAKGKGKDKKSTSDHAIAGLKKAAPKKKSDGDE